ncbi:MAG: SAF domain-containing protein, partial [Dermatophilaceae bacterium]
LLFPGITGAGRRSRWRRRVLRRLLAGVLVATAVVVVVGQLTPAPPATIAVVAAARPVPAGAELADDDLRLVAVVADTVQPGSITDPAVATGRRVGAALVPGETLTRSRLVPRSAVEGLARGEVAVHVVVADPAVLGLLGPGQRVTVVAASGGRPLVRGATVLATDPPVPEDLVDSLSGSPARGVVLELPAAAAERLLAGHGGLDGPPVVNVVATGPG